MPSWNPDAPTDIGLEWNPLQQINQVVGGSAIACAQVFQATATETVTDIFLYLTPMQAGAVAAGPVCVDIYPTGSELVDGQSAETSSAFGFEDFTLVSGSSSVITFPPYGTPAGASSSGNQYLMPGTAGDNIDVSFSSSSYVDGPRVLGIDLSIGTVGNRAWTCFDEMPDVPYHWVLGNTSVSNAYTLNTDTFHLIDHIPSTNAMSIQAPTPASVREFASGVRTLRMVCQRVGQSTGRGPGYLYFLNYIIGNPDMSSGVLTVYQCNESRVAFGAGRIPVQTSPLGGTWIRVPLQTPAAGTNWTKESGSSYTIVVRRPRSCSNGGSGLPQGNLSTPHLSLQAFSWRALGQDTVPWGGAQYQDGTLDYWGRPTGLSTPKLGEVMSWRLADGPDSVDSQPYVAINAAAVSDTNTVSQTIGTMGGGEWSQLQLTLSTASAPTQPLTIQVTHGGSPVAGPINLTATAAEANTPIYGQWRHIQVDLGTVIAAGAETLTVLLTSVTPDAHPWLILDVAGTDSSTMGNGYAAGAESGDSLSFSDLPVLLIDPPDGPTNLLATLGSQALTAPADCQALPASVVAGIGFIVLAWTQSTVGAGFDHYQVQRSENGGAWLDVASITDESVTSWTDYEPQLGVMVAYQLATIRATDSSRSAWSNTASASVGGQSAELIFTSNENPDLNLALFPVYDPNMSMASIPITLPPGVRQYTFPEAAEGIFQTVYGRDYQVYFHPTERRGVTFQVNVLISAIAVPAVGDVVGVFDPIRNLAWADLSYVCVRDTSGNKWMAAVQVTTGVSSVDRHMHFAQLTVTEITDVPSTPDAAGPPALWDVGYWDVATWS
jgi:hypothetical protein